MKACINTCRYADTPIRRYAYRGQAGFEFLKILPVTWDETRFVAGEPGQYMVIARRSGETWYLGAINNWSARTVQIPLGFLADGKWELDLLHDASLDDSHPTAVAKTVQAVDATTQLSVPLASGGGLVGTLTAR